MVLGLAWEGCLGVAYIWEALLAPIGIERGVWVRIPIHAD